MSLAQFFRPIKTLKTKVAKLQHTLDILSCQVVESSTITGNPYPTYSLAIAETAKKYEGTADWGIQQVRNIIDVRSAFIIGNGIKVKPKEKKNSEREVEFIQGMLTSNNFDRELTQELAKEAEIEGRCLVKLIPNIEKKRIDVRFISYTTTNYKVHAKEDDYQEYEKVTYKDGSQEVTLEQDEFVYKKFAGRVHKVNEIMPKVAMVLRQCEAIDKALVDWRKINHLFASPTPHFECMDKKQSEDIYDILRNNNWDIGKVLVTPGKFTLVETSGTGVQSAENEITTNAKMISGATGVPVHFLGLPDLMSNRAVSHDLMEFVNASTKKETEVWVGFYEELFYKALKMANKVFKKNFSEDGVNVSIVKFTEGQMREIAETWLPLYNARVITIRDLLSRIPDIDVEETIKQKNEEDNQMLARIKAESENT
jgi:hypothetical protein